MKTSFNSMFFLLAFGIIMLLGNCSKNSGSDNQVTTFETSDTLSLLEDVYENFNDGYSIMDIPSIPIPEMLLLVEDDTLQQALSLNQDFNNYLIHPYCNPADYLKKKKTTHEEPGTVSCTTSGRISHCTYFQDHGDFTETIEQTASSTFVSWDYYIKGTLGGVDYGDENYEIQNTITYNDSKSMITELYRAPVPSAAAGSRISTYSVHSYDQYSIYTPWGESTVRNVVYTATLYTWNASAGEEQPLIRTITSIIGPITQMQLDLWGIIHQELYMSKLYIFNSEDNTCAWLSYNEDGEITGTGSWK